MIAVSVQNLREDLLRGVSVADKRYPITTFHQFGGKGIVLNKALVIPSHLGETIRSIEYVSVQTEASVGKHQQAADEIYYIEEGKGELITNEMVCQVRAGDLVMAPRTTTHSLRNLQTRQPLRLLVIEVKAPLQPEYPPMVMETLPTLLALDSDRYRALIGWREVPIPLMVVALSAFFARPWGDLTLIELPPGCRLAAYSVPNYDENLFVVHGHASIQVGELEVPFLTDEDAECGLNVLIPANLSRQITNKSSAEPLLILSVQIRHDVA